MPGVIQEAGDAWHNPEGQEPGDAWRNPEGQEAGGRRQGVVKAKNKDKLA